MSRIVTKNNNIASATGTNITNVSSVFSGRSARAVFDAIGGKRFKPVILSLLLILLGSAWNNSYAGATYYWPSGVTITGTQTHCVGAATAITESITTSSASVFLGASSTVTYQWYYNTTGATTTGGSIAIGGASGSYTAGSGAFTTGPLSAAQVNAIATTPGTVYTFLLFVSWSGGTHASGNLTSSTVTVTITGPPTGVTATASPNPICVGSALTLTGTATGGTSFLWVKPGGTAITATGSLSTGVGGVGVVLANAGIYTLTATNSCGSVVATTSSLVVNATAPTSVSATASPNPVCAGLNLTLTGAATGASTYAWTGPGGTGIASPTSLSTGVTGVVAANAGVYHLAAINACGTTNANSASVTVQAAPTGVSATASPTPLCVGNNLTLTGAATGATTYFWTQPGGTAITSPTSISTGVTSVAAGNAGVYTLYASIGTCSTSATTASVVVHAAVTGVSASATPDPICSGQNLTLTGTAGGGAVTFAWSGPGGTGITAPTSLSTGVTGVAVGNAGVYTLSASTTGCPTITATSAIVTVNALPTISGSALACVGLNTSLSGAPSGGTWLSVTTGVATIGGGTGLLHGVSAGTSIISYTAPSTGCVITRVETVNAIPATPTISNSAPSICNGGSSTLFSGSTPVGGSLFAAQSFETGVPGTGWNSIGGLTYLIQQNAAGTSNPSIAAAEAGTRFLELHSFSDNCSGCSESIYSPTFSMIGVTGATLTFWVYRDATGSYPGSSGYAGEGFGIYLNSTPTVGGTSLGFVPRAADAAITGPLTGTSTTGSSNWYQYTVTVPATYGGTNYIIINAVSYFGNDCYLDNMTLTGTISSPITTTWSPTTDLYTDAGFTTAYAGTALSTVYYHPTTTSLTTANVITATNTSGACTASATTTVTVHATPAAIGGGTAPVCTGANTTLTESFTDGAWGSASSAIATVTSGGVVGGVAAGTTTISYSNGCGTAPSVIVTVAATPVVIATPSYAPNCSGAGVSTTASGATTYVWSPAGTSGTTGAAFTANPGSNTNYTVTGTTGTCSSTGIFSVVISTNPTVAVSPSIINRCSAAPGNLVTASGATTYSWLPTLGLTNAAIASPSVTATSNVVYTVTGTNTAGCTGINTVTVNVTPSPTITLGSSPSACSGATSANLTYSATTNSPNKYTIVYSTAAHTAGFVDVVNATLVSSPIVLTVPGAAPAAVYAATVTVTNTTTGCTSSNNLISVFVSGTPGSISGPSLICPSSTPTLSNTTAGGLWSTSNTFMATIGSVGTTTTLTAGVSAGTVIVTYTTGCGAPGYATKIVTINTFAACDAPCVNTYSSGCSADYISNVTFAGINQSSACTGGTIYTTPVASVTQGSSYPISVSIVAGGGILAQGYISIWIDFNHNGIYDASEYFGDGSVLAFFGSGTNSTTIVVPPDAVSGVTRMRVRTTRNTDPGSGGACTNVARGETEEYYVNISCNTAAVTGLAYACTSGGTTVFADATSGGAWVSSNTNVATVAADGTVTGAAAGTSTISYRIAAQGCFANQDVNIVSGPSAISGSSIACTGQITTLSDAVPIGTWSDGGSASATVDASGNVTGVAAGTAIISYTACLNSVYQPMTVNATPTISGITNLCTTGFTSTTLTGAPTGGTWVSGTTSVATIGVSSGFVSAVSAGTSTISYNGTNGCTATVTEVVGSGVPVISTTVTPTTICSGGTATLAASSTGAPYYTESGITYSPVSFTPTGTFNSGTTPDGGGTINDDSYYNITLPFTFTYFGTNYTAGSLASISTNGTLALGASYETVSMGSLPNGVTTDIISLFGRDMDIRTSGNITYGTTGVAPNRQFVVSYNSVPDYSTGVLETGQIVLYEGSNNIDFHVTTAQGSLHTFGIQKSDGATAFTVPGQNYTTTTISNGGYRFAPSVNYTWSPATFLSSTTGATTTATVVSATTIYTVTAANGGCASTATATVSLNPDPVAISGGTSPVCAGSSMTVSDAVTGGSWSSSDPTIATVVAASNPTTVTGVAGGTAIITYTSVCGLNVTTVVTINSAVITGIPDVCVGSNTTLTGIPSGGTWTSSATGFATVGLGTGIVHGVAVGTSTISYFGTNGCNSAVVSAVNNTAPGPISGAGSLFCETTSITLSDGTAGGLWLSDNTAVATVGSTTTTVGTVVGVSGGTATITYTNGCGVAPTKIVSVNPGPAAITGSSLVCVGQSISLGETVGGVNWTTSAAAFATVSGSGVVTGVAIGNATITATLPSTSCFVTKAITVNSNAVLPSVTASASPSAVCLGYSSEVFANTASSSMVVVGIPYSYVSVATATGLSSDDGSTAISMPFTFNFFGTNYSTAYACANGFVSFGSSTGSLNYTAVALPSTSAPQAGTPQAMIAAFWHDMNSSTGGNITYGTSGSAPNRKFAISWNGVYDFSGTAPQGTNTGEVIFYEGQTFFDIMVTTTGNGGNAYNMTCGAQNATGTVGVAVPGENGVNYTATNQGWRFYKPTYNYVWSPATFLSSTTATNPFVDLPTTTTSYSVDATDITTGCQSVASVTVTVNPLPTTAATSAVACTGGSISLFSNATGTATYSWAGPLGYTSTQANPVITGATTAMAGTYTVTVASPSSCLASSTVVVTVNTLSITAANDGPACVGGTVNLTSTPGGAAIPTSYAWSGPSSFSASTQNATLTTSATTAMTGIYTVTVTAAGSGCTLTNTTNVTINTIGIAAANTSPACVGGTIDLTSTPSGSATPTGYAWSGPSFGALTQNTNLTTSATTAMAGVYTVTVTALGSACSATTTTTVTVNTIGITAFNDGPACVGGTVNLSSTPSGSATPTGYSWSGPGYSTTGQNPVLTTSATTAMTGIYTVTVTASGSACTSIATTNVTINTIGITAFNDGPACVGGTVNLTSTPSGSATPTGFAWSGPSYSALIQNPTLTTSATTDMTGIYTVTVTALGSACTATGTTNVTINTIGITAANTSPACVGGTIDLSSTPSGSTTPTGYAWSGPSFSALIQNPNLTTSATTDMNGVYTVTVTALGSACTATATTNVTVNTIGITASNDGPACVGGTVNLSSTPSGDATPTGYAWSGPGYGTTGQNPVLTTSATTAMTGIYTVTVTASGSACTSIATTNVTINTIGITASNDGPACVGGTVNLTSTPSGSAIPTGYAWSGPSYSSLVQSPTLTTSATTDMTGIYTVTVTALGSACSATTTTNVVINDLGITAANTSPACVGGTIDLTSTPSGSATPTGYAWSGPSFSALIQNPNLTTSATTDMNGVYTVTVTALGSACTATATTNVTVNTIGITASNDGPACVGGTVNLSSTPSGDATPTGYAWSGPGYGTTGQNPVLTTSATTAMTGIYTVTVTASGSACSSIATTNVTINTIGITASNDGPACVGGTVNLTSTPSGSAIPTGYAWSGPSYSSLVQSPTLTTSATTDMTGIYTVTVTALGSACSATVTTNVVVNTLTTAPSNDGPACEGSTVNLYSNIVTTTVPTGYSWSGPSFSASTPDASLTSVTTAVSGVYNFTVTATGSGCVAIGSTTVIVNNLGVAANNDGPACVGGTVNLTATPSGSLVPTNYSWVGPNGFTSTDQNPVITGVSLLAAGTYTVTMSGVGTGCTTTSTTTVIINTIGITASNDGPACVGGTVNLTSTPSGTAVPTGYAWSGPSYSSLVESPTLTTSATTDMTGIYTVTVTASGSGCSATTTTNVVINDLGITANNDGPACLNAVVILTSTPSGSAVPTSYSWSGPASFTNTNQNTSIAPVAFINAGVYTVTVNANGSGCTATATTNVIIRSLSINAFNDAPTCAGLTTNLTSVPGGTSVPTSYTWSGPLLFNATTQNTMLSPATVPMTGTYTVVVTAVGTGCIAYATTDVLILPTPVAISGISQMCVGGTSTLSDATPGGIWTSLNTGIATIGTAGASTSPHLVTGLFAGTSTISYTEGDGCAAVVVITVNPNPAISGMAPVCIGMTVTLSDNIVGGVWASSNTHASVGSSSGIVTGLANGTSIITYTLPTTCFATAVATVNPSPSAIGGTPRVCQGQTTTLNTTSGGGVWSSNNPSVATVGSTGGTTTVTGILAGTAVISYSLATGCYSTVVVTVNALAPITGNAPVCQGSTVMLSDAALGGLWTSGTLARATVGSASGIVTGVSGGTVRISYTTFEGCLATVIATVNPTGTILGTAAVCEGGTTSLSDATTGGAWTSSNGNATVGSAVSTVTTVTGVVAGTATISYTIASTGCSATRTVTVNAAPGIVNGTASMCSGASTTLTDAVSGGTWISGSVGVATVGSLTGTVTGVAAGTSIISYKMAGGCQATRIITVYVTPGAITTNTPVCQSSTVLLHDGTAGGSWSSLATSVATVGSTGLVLGVSGGTATIVYGILATGCQVTAVVTVNPIAAITGTAPMCVGTTVNLTDVTPGGNWSSSNPAKATVDASGLVSGIAGGTANITYLIPATGCKSVVIETVNALPAAIAGTKTVCSGGSTVHLSDATTGGSWSSLAGTGNISVDGSGNVTGLSAGTATVSYSVSGCGVAATVTVNLAPAAITGNAPVCAGSTLALGETVSGGVWSSSASGVATVNSSGVVTGVAGGASNITYLTGAGCSASVTVTVSPINPITGNPSICLGSTSNLADATLGGTWSSLDPLTASVGTSGVVTGVALGTTTISYSIASGCVRTITVTVNPVPSPIIGTPVVCVAGTTTLADDGGGTWSSGNTFVATVGLTTGIVTGMSAGTAKISYFGGSGCSVNVTVTVNAGPSTIGGAASVCTGSTVTLSDFVSGGVWSSLDPTVTVNPTVGTVFGVSSGTAIITYSIGSCTRTHNMVVNTTPAPVSGNPVVCVGRSTFLSDATTPGVSWTSDNTSVATISGSGAVLGVSVGTANMTYSIGTGCNSSVTVTVNAVPTGILGNTAMCPGNTVVLSDLTGGGTWTSNNPGIASIGTDGTVTGMSGGLATITYAVNGGGCYATTVVTVTAITPVNGASTVCTGSTVTLTNATSGGTWSSPDATVTISTPSVGSVLGVTPGTATISYTFPGGGCSATKIITVTPTPGAINGNGLLCIGTQLALTDAVAGGVWSSSSTTVAAVVGSTGVTTGMATGTANITYALGGCRATVMVSVNSASAVTGLTSICAGALDNMHNATIGGTWSSSNPAVGTISTTGVLTSFVAGTTTVSYTLSSGCVSTATVTVNPVPDAITGNGPVCVGGTLALSDDITGGTWYSSTGVVSIDGSGNVTAIAIGTAGITYTAAGCSASTVVTVGATPAAITGTLVVCEGGSTILNDATLGGVWTSTTGNATVVGSTGVVTGVTAGTTTISYSVTGCGSATADVTINVAPAAVTGGGGVCVGSIISLTDVTGGGVWSSSNSHATVDVSGNVTGVSIGTASISYTAGGCSAATLVTVTGIPAAITAPSFICLGSTIVLYDATPGGLWSTSDAAITLGTGTGVVTGVAVGTASITYSTGTGCTATTILSVNVATSPIFGSLNLCIGTSTLYTDATSGGAWSSSNPSVASVGTDGTVNGVAVGAATISYNTAGCISTQVITVNPSPAGISGLSAVCEDLTNTQMDATVGGAWSTTSTYLSIDGSGNVTGLHAGVATITYTTGFGCFVTKDMTINPAPSAINGMLTVCVGGSTFLSDGTSGGVSWTSSNTSVATISFSGAVASALSVGTTTITYSISTGCFTTAVVTVNAQPAGITNNSALCAGSSIVLSDVTGGGTWISNNTDIATVGTDGTLTGISGGNATITYAIYGSGCRATVVATVSPLANAGTISGSGTVCAGSTTNLNDPVSGGVWSSTATGVATVNPFGVVSGITPGTTTISYTATNACGSVAATMVVTVNATADAGIITGSGSVCVGSVLALTDATAGGVWTSSNGNATVDASGNVTGVTAGTSRISYTVTNGCGNVSATQIVTISPLPAAITGSSFVCVGGSTLLHDATSGGAWSTTDVTASVGAGTGLVSGLIVGTATIAYTTAAGCVATTVISVNSATAAISGASAICVGANTLLTDVIAGGVWSSSSTSTATVGTDGTVTGVAAGTATISYVAASGCAATTPITVNPTPSGITGPASVCANSTVALTDATSGGTWSTLSTNISVDGSGNVTGITSGAASVTYTSGSGCSISRSINVNPQPSAINGMLTVCVGGSTFLSDATSGGVSWTSSNTSVATISFSGAVASALSAGTTIVTYSISTGCYITAVLTVNAQPAGITNNSALCAGTSIVLSDATGGGTWSSNNTGVATVGTDGTLTGVTGGNATITYTVYGAGCFATTVATVNAATPVNGSHAICVGANLTLTDATSGGAWSSDNAAVGTVSTGGVVTGTGAGTANITYTTAAGCTSSTVITVNGVPSAITGAATVCVGAVTALTDASIGGAWSASNGNVTVDGSGNVTGVTAGTSIVSYGSGSTCSATAIVTINAVPVAISGTTVVCVGSTTSLSDATTAGIWSSSATGTATINGTTGLVTGVAGGTAVISYTKASTGCATTTIVTVNALPLAINGNTVICAGSSILLTDVTSGGAWTSGTPAVATVGTDGTVTGVTGGTSKITYTSTAGCNTTTIVTVSAISPITGIPSACIGFTTALSDASIGGTWSSSDPSVATIGSSSGLVNALSAGTTTVVYTIPSGCSRSVVVTINAALSPITGSLSVCQTFTTQLSDASAGGTWTSGSPSIATVVGSTGLVTGSVAGTARITYTVGGSCASYAVVTVNAQPSGIGGSATVCNGSTITLSDLVPGGDWTSTGFIYADPSGTTVSTITALGVGTGTATYTMYGTGCYKTKVITVNPLPTDILGNLAVCGIGSVTFLSDATAGTSWAISPVGTATVSTSGRVYGVSLGTATVTYTGTNTCKITAVVTVDVVPSVKDISGPNNVSHGATVSLSDLTAGGVWSSANSSIASVDVSGNVTGVAVAGTTTITYSYTDGIGCTGRATQSMTVHSPAPHAHGTTVSGATAVSAGATVNIADETSSGIWSSSNTTVATVDDAGTVTGIMPGTANITHIVTYSDGEVATTITPIVVNALAVDIRVVPNPNNGTFTIKGSLGTMQDEEVSLEVTDVLGQIVYKNKITARGGKINEKVSMDNTYANGMYMLTVTSGTENKVFHFVIEK